jgi:hypothetical protein
LKWEDVDLESLNYYFKGRTHIHYNTLAEEQFGTFEEGGRVKKEKRRKQDLAFRMHIGGFSKRSMVRKR